MKHINFYNQTHKKSKKILTAGISLFVAGTLVAVGVGKHFKQKSKDTSTPTKPDTTMVTPEFAELVLTEDFDINDPAAVTKRAQDIYNLSEGAYTVLDIQNTIYIIHEMYDKITYPKSLITDDKKFYYIKSLSNLFGDVLDDYLADYAVTMGLIVNDKNNNPVFAGTTNPVPCAYMWMAQNDEAKKQAISLAKVYYEQRENIRNGNLAAMTITANDYYDLYVKSKSSKLSDGEKVILFSNFDVINDLFTPFLSELQVSELEGALLFAGPEFGIIFNNSVKNLALPEGNKKNLVDEVIEYGEKRREKDKIAAESRIEAAGKTDPSVVDQGGKPVSGSAGKQEVINDKVTTTVVGTSEFVVPIPDEGISEDFVSGGDIVEEHTTKTVPSTTEPSETITYVDDENIPVMNEEEYSNAIKNYKKK